MKKFIAAFLTSVLIMSSSTALATPPEFSGGVNNEYEYQEVIFITGTPIKLTGKVDVSEKDKDTQKVTSYKFTLENKDLGAKLDRKIDFTTDLDKRNDKGQTIANTSITKATETLKVGADKYELDDYQFSKSDVIDNRPASDFYSGNIKGRKYYKINKDAGEVIVDISGANVGYKNFWGNSDTQLLNYSITSKKKAASSSTNNQTTYDTWQGTVKINVSDSMAKTLKYAENQAGFSSFNGGNMRVTNEDMVSSYDYNLPKVENNKIVADKRNSGVLNLSSNMSSKLERLIVPKFRDLGGHWAQDSIEKLYSLDVFDTTGAIFAPDAPMNRIDYIKGVIRACDIRTSLDTLKPKKPSKKDPPEVSPFSDVSTKDENYKYVKGGVEKGIVNGANGTFKPKNALTRAEAITILIRALGFDNKAPDPGYSTSFADDNQIPYWAKDSIYMAREVGLVYGDNANRINPNKVMTRAEASAMLVRFLEFLQKDLKKDYRDNIINFN